MNQWAQGKRAVIIGQPASVFPQRLAAFCRQQGLEVAIVTRQWDGPSQLQDGTKVLQSFGAESAELRDQLASLREYWRRFERYVNHWERSRYRHAMGPPEQQDYHPSFAAAFVNAVSIPSFVAQLDPAFVFGQEAFAHGLATALCWKHPKVLMPWGGDVFQFAETSSVAFEMVRRSLSGVDLVAPGGPVGVQRVVDRFGVTADKVHAAPWGIDRTLFRRASQRERAAFCTRYAVAPSSLIVVNVRRFMPNWGSDIALEAFLRLVEQDGRLQFFALGGQGGSEPYVAEARKRIAAKNLERRIRIFDGHITDAALQELVSVTDVFTSLVRGNDMGSASIQECASAGATPVLSSIPSTREMERRGFRAFFVEKLDPAGVVDALRSATQAPPALRAEMSAANQRYLEVHEDRERNMQRLLDLIADCHVEGASAEREARPDALTVIDEIVRVRRDLDLLSKLVGFPRICARRLRNGVSHGVRFFAPYSPPRGGSRVDSI
jgi:glycosyltransferase involved in cell wall biosynthesis